MFPPICFHQSFPRIFVIINRYFSVEEEIKSLIGQKKRSIFSFQHLKKSKQVLHKIRGKEGETNWRKHVVS